MKKRNLTIVCKQLPISTAQPEKVLSVDDLRSAFERARTISLLHGVDCQVVETTSQKHTVMTVDSSGNVKTIRTTIANMAKKLDIPCKCGKTWASIKD